LVKVNDISQVGSYDLHKHLVDHPQETDCLSSTQIGWEWWKHICWATSCNFLVYL